MISIIPSLNPLYENFTKLLRTEPALSGVCRDHDGLARRYTCYATCNHCETTVRTPLINTVSIPRHLRNQWPQ